MSKCLFKALKAVDLDRHISLFRSLGYDSAGSLTRFRTEHFQQLELNEQELLRLVSLLDVLKETSNDGKLCSHQFQSKPSTTTIRASWSDESKVQRTSHSNKIRSTQYNNDFIFQRPSTVLSRSARSVPNRTASQQRILGSKSFFNRPSIQHVKVKSYNYGIPTHRRTRSIPSRHENFTSHGSIFVSHHDLISYAKPAEIYVYARKRPLLSSESNFQDSIVVPDNKRILVAEKKSNLDCSPLLKKSEFQFDQAFGGETSNKQIFDQTVFPFLSSRPRTNLTYICFGQTGSGKSHTIFGSRSTDGLLIYCTQLLLNEIDLHTHLICSFYEIYNNQVYDLNGSGKRLFVREDGNHHVNVIGGSEIVIRNLDTLRGVIDDGLGRRHHGKSAFNSNSSRSHAIFQLLLKNSSQSSENFRLIFIDLAGSERATDAQNNQRQTRREGAQINWSLLALKECIRSMDMTHSHAPFRQSKLTHILRDSLVGSKTRTCLMANVSPPDDCCQCSLNTLQYASRIRDISIRHRHRTVPVIPTTINETVKDSFVKSQSTFKPATASTPVHRLISSSHPFAEVDVRLTKTIDIDWQIADDDDDDDLPITGTASNRQGKFVRPTKNIEPIDQSPSSYFPLPQTDLKTTSSNKRTYNNLRLMYDDGNERHWKKDPSVEQIATTRTIPVVSMDEHRYSSATATESLGAKISQVATKDRHQQKPSPRTTNPKEIRQSDFLTHRDDLLSIVSNRLNNANRRSLSLNTTKQQKKRINADSNGSQQSKPNTPRSTHHPLKSSSSTASLNGHVNPEKKSKQKNKVSSTMNFHKIDSNTRRSSTRPEQQRTVPLRGHHSAETNNHRTMTSKINSHIDQNQSKPLDERSFTPTSTPQPTSVPSPALDHQVKLSHHALPETMSPTSKALINNPWLTTPSYPSPSKEFGLRVSEQLNALRELLENRLTENAEIPRTRSSPEKTRANDDRHVDDDDQEVARNFPQINFDFRDQRQRYENHFPSSSSLSTPLEDHQRLQASLSLLSNELNQARVSSTGTSPSTSTITSNLAAKIERQETQVLTTHSHPMSNDVRLHSPMKTATSDSDHPSISPVRSPLLLPPFNRLEIGNDFKNVPNQLFDNSLLTSSSFDALMTSLKNMREKTLDFAIRSNDDHLIPVAE